MLFYAATTYHVSVKTGDKFGAGTDANVFLEMFGEKGESGRLPLESAEKRGNKFERDQTDMFRLEAPDIGRMQRILIGHDGSGAGSAWYLEEVRISVPTRGENYLFLARRWLDDDKGGREVELSRPSYAKASTRTVRLCCTNTCIYLYNIILVS